MRANSIVVRHVERAAAGIVDSLVGLGTATIHEAMGRRGFAGAHLRPIQQGASIAGSAITVSCHPGDNLMIHAAVEMCQPGDILVVTNTAPSTHGMFGDLLAGSLMSRGVRGLVIDAGVRDTADLRSMGFPVWSQYVSCEGTVKATGGSVNVPVTLGTVIVNPGDVVCADDDGVVIVPRRDAADALALSNSRIEKEAGTRTRLNAGEIGLDIYGLRATLERVGVVYVDSLSELD
jgi:4-hydroxy-4-methyl-2-oxoglutarate aldolase